MLRMEWFIKNFIPESNKKLSVLDVGSRIANNTSDTYKKLLNENKFNYTGLDLEPGLNVDLVIKYPYNWEEIPPNSFDIVISGQAFEHIEFFWITMYEIVRVLKPNGKICIIAPSKFIEHRHPVDCYRFLTDGMIAICNYYKLNVLHAHDNRGKKKWCNNMSSDAMLIAEKKYLGVDVVDLKNYELKPSNHEILLKPFKYKTRTNNFIVRNIRRIIRLAINIFGY